MNKFRRIISCVCALFLTAISSCSNGSSGSTSNLKGAEIQINGSVVQNIEGIGDIHYLRVRNNNIVFKFAEYVETNKDANWTVSTDIEGKDVIPSRTVELSLGHPLAIFSIFMFQMIQLKLMKRIQF